jgi:hypothetical protein
LQNNGFILEAFLESYGKAKLRRRVEKHAHRIRKRQDPPAPEGAGGASTADCEGVERMYMIGDAEGATMQREAKNTPAMAPVRLLGPIGRRVG